MFSPGYIFKATYLLIRHPLVITKVTKGSKAINKELDNIRRERWRMKPIPSKRVCGYVIFLNQSDLGVCPSIGIDGWFELEVTTLFRKLVKKGMTVVDVGANVGWFTLMAAKLVGESGKIFAFEPEPQSYSLLKKSISVNRFTNTNAFQKCVSDSNGTRELFLGKDNLGSHSTVRKLGQKSIVVESITLDEMFQDETKIDMLKIDVEGAEPQVISGGKKALAISNHVILEWNLESWIGFESLLDYLYDRFDVFKFVGRPSLVREVSLQDLLRTDLANLYLQRKLSE